MESHKPLHMEFLQKGASGSVWIPPHEARQLLDGTISMTAYLERKATEMKAALADVLCTYGVPDDRKLVELGTVIGGG